MSNDQSGMTNGANLMTAMFIVMRCRAEGREAKVQGQPATACPYADELERSGWLDGWSKA